MTLEVKASSQWTINDPTATDFSEVEGLHRYCNSGLQQVILWFDGWQMVCAIEYAC